jgi:putative addiction module antidote
MVILERKLRKIGNTVGITLSKEFLESIGVNESDIVFVDEEKLKDAFVKKEVKEEQRDSLALLTAASVQKHNELYKKLVDR